MITKYTRAIAGALYDRLGTAQDRSMFLMKAALRSPLPADALLDRQVGEQSSPAVRKVAAAEPTSREIAEWLEKRSPEEKALLLMIAAHRQPKALHGARAFQD